jgi:hypothetical protein
MLDSILSSDIRRIDPKQWPNTCWRWWTRLSLEQLIWMDEHNWELSELAHRYLKEPESSQKTHLLCFNPPPEIELMLKIMF